MDMCTWGGEEGDTLDHNLRWRRLCTDDGAPCAADDVIGLYDNAYIKTATLELGPTPHE